MLHTLALLSLLAPVVPQSPAPAPEPLLARVAVVGASVSGGFDLRRTYGVDLDLARVLCAALEEEADVRVFADTFLFSQPLPRGEKLVAAAAEMDPTLVIALDLPFWFGYGDGLSPERRLELLDLGLALIERLDAPVVVGDFPDMRAATEVPSAFGFPILSKGQVPAPETLEKLNARLAAWVAEDDSRVLVSLDRFHRALREGGEVSVRGNTWGGDDLAKLLLEDQLHPSVEGDIALVLLALDRVAKAGLGLAEDRVVWDAEEVRARLDEATAPEREEAAERERRREERRRQREKEEREEEEQGRAPRDASGAAAA